MKVKHINTNKKSQSVIVVLHEIYGVNKYIISVCKYYKGLGYDVVCPNLLNTAKTYSYEEEQEAYKNFVENVGFKAAAEKVKSLILKLKKEYNKVFLLGFSIGATIAWILSDEDKLCHSITGYYGSRIRSYKQINPRCKALLIFSEDEKSFSIDELIGSLKEKKNVQIHVLKGSHGFNDKFSKKYNELSYEKALSLVTDFLK